MIRLVSCALILLLSALTAQAQVPPKQWIPLPGSSLKDYLSDGGKIVASSSLMWPDGRPALVVYVSRGQEAYRCIDWYDKHFRANGFMCYRLVATKKPSQR